MIEQLIEINNKRKYSCLSALFATCTHFKEYYWLIENVPNQTKIFQKKKKLNSIQFSF